MTDSFTHFIRPIDYLVMYYISNFLFNVVLNTNMLINILAVRLQAVYTYLLSDKETAR